MSKQYKIKEFFQSQATGKDTSTPIQDEVQPSSSSIEADLDPTPTLSVRPGPPYPDLAVIVDPDDSVKESNLKGKWSDCHLYEFPTM